MRQMLAFALKRVPGVRVDEAGDGVEGLRKIKAEVYDLVISDINMPMMDGLKLVSLVRQDERYRDVPIMIVTTESGEEDRNRAFALGANAFITKPIQAPTVAKKVKELLS